MTLHNDNIFFSEPAHLKSSELPAGSDNSPDYRRAAEGCRARDRSPFAYAAAAAEQKRESRQVFLVRRSQPRAAYPLTPVKHTLSILSANDPHDPARTLQAFHPFLSAKPAPGAVVYSCWIPHLRETFSMVALDYKNDEHLRLFHEWQNDPRFSQGWERTGTLVQHREYLRNVEQDAHQVAILAKRTAWAYTYYNAGDFDRGRHSLVGDVRFRGPHHRVMAWWSSLMHYLFLDDPRTMDAVGEPKGTIQPSSCTT
ncbi:related to aerobactin siderophore biosynthesis protein iucB [Claviceps purpurea 20.1]|uniref:Related to aerobactin siderophore biosynthesis protein iucB n=1 Tax=Claviceps purpurea (strain 20.1) TaxID=1111077 RepID=M1W267_CLAP2|nr:related to aerobactin siderophore biosynthesis protein iucB [Claviceps purpurea 20.1]